jgi:hypothetical protein
MSDAPVSRDPKDDIAAGLMTEQLTDDWGFYIRSAKRLEKFKSRFDEIEFTTACRSASCFV